MATTVIHTTGAKHHKMHPNKVGAHMENAAEKATAHGAHTVKKIHASASSKHGAKGMHLKHGA